VGLGLLDRLQWPLRPNAAHCFSAGNAAALSKIATEVQCSNRQIFFPARVGYANMSGKSLN
jgi:hypothetical protein